MPRTAPATSPLDERLAEVLASDPEAMADPFAVWHDLLERGPVHRLGPRALVPRYRDVRRLLRNKTTLSNRAFIEGSQAEAIFAALTPEQQRAHLDVSEFESHYVSRNDGDAHTRLRSIAHRAFTPRRIAAMEATVRRYTEELVEELTREEVPDIIDTLAYRLPLLVITEMLDVPHDDHERIHRWSNALARNRGADDPRALMTAHTAIGEFRRYVEDELLPSKREAPPDTDLVAGLMDAEQGDRLTPDELAAMFVILLFAGHETTTNLIGNGLLALLQHRDQWQRLCDDPSLAPTAVEELLRFVSPVQWLLRVALEDIELDGARLERGETVFLLIAAANRDPEIFDRPDVLDLTRPNARDHIGFGFGPHFCIGNVLARLEGAAVLEALARRFPAMTLATDRLTWRGNAKLRALAALPVHLEGRI
jgi:cytochrome P450